MDLTSFSQSHCSAILFDNSLKSQGVVHGSDNHMFAPIHLGTTEKAKSTAAQLVSAIERR
jgi:hypothetical protein